MKFSLHVLQPLQPLADGNPLRGCLHPSPLEEKATVLTEELQKLPVIAAAFDLLEKNLPKTLRYHTMAHTREVVHDAVLLALQDELSQKDITLLAIAAAWHDTGFVARNPRNEPIGARKAGFEMRRFGYDPAEIRTVMDAIKDTALCLGPDRIPAQRLTSGIARYLLDADLANFGSVTFRTKSRLVFNEITGSSLKNFEELLARPEGVRFLMGTLGMVRKHTWQTPAARWLWQAQKEQNLSALARDLQIPGERAA